MRHMRILLCLLGGLALASGARAADLTVTLPTVTATPGSTVQIPIDVSPNPSAFGVYSLDFRSPEKCLFESVGPDQT